MGEFPKAPAWLRSALSLLESFRLTVFSEPMNLRVPIHAWMSSGEGFFFGFLGCLYVIVDHCVVRKTYILKQPVGTALTAVAIVVVVMTVLSVFLLLQLLLLLLWFYVVLIYLLLAVAVVSGGGGRGAVVGLLLLHFLISFFF